MATILVVDDRPSNRAYLTKLLGRGGHRMLEASDGANALAQMYTEHPDLVITDILMPTMDGYELVQRVRSDPSISLTPIIFYTATYSAPQAKALAAACGVSSVLSKPCPQQEILTAVNRELSAGGSPAGIPPTDSRDGESTATAAGDSAQALPDDPAMTRRVASRLAELLEAGMKMMTERDPARLVELYFSTVCELVHSSYAAVGMLDQDEQAIRHVYAKGIDAAIFRGEAGRGGTLGSLLRGKRILQMSDAGRRDDMEGLPQGHPPVGCMLGIPVFSADRIYGWLYFADGHDGSGFSEDDVFIANAVARQLAMLYENATLYDVIQRHAGKLQMEATERKRAEEKQREVTQLLDNIVENIPTAVQLKSVKDGFRIRMWNKAAEAMYGVPSGDAIGRTVQDLWPEADAARMHASDLELAANKSLLDFPDRLAQTKDRGDIHIHMRKVALCDAAGNATHLLVIADDITEQKQAAMKIGRLNRVYAMLSGINTAIVRIRERDALFRETCRIAVSEGGFILARVIEVDAGGRARIAATSETDTQLFQGIVEAYNSDPAKSQSMLALALSSGQPLISNDVANDPRIPNRAKLTKDGNYALALLPIIVEQRIAGTVILRSREAGLFDENELHLLRELISNLSFALEHIEKETRIRRLTRVYAVLSGINSLIVRVRDRDELFKEACRIAVEHGRFRLAWIGLVDLNEMKLVPVASAGSTEDLLALFKQTFSLGDAEPSGNSYSAQAIRDGKACVSNDVQNDARILFKDQHAARGSRSMTILPLQIAGEVVGLLALYSEEIGFFDDEELKLLTELAGDIAFSVDHIDKRDRLNYLAYYDELTGLANRSLFLERTAQYMRSAVSGGHKLALFFVDLERFRNINDSLGRPVGDALLKQVSAWLSRAVGDPSLLARLGADHFAVVLPEVKQDGNVTGLIDKSVREFLDHSFQVDDTEFRIAAKVGIALFPDDGADADTLLRNAEVALKKAKARGERFLFYKSKMTDSVAGKLSLETQLRQALDREEFVLHYQPKVLLEGGRLTGAEALIRWNDPLTGLVPPGRFIPILEETGLILDVGRWALRKAISDYLRWRAAGLPAVRIAVNVSPLQMRNPGFAREISQVIGVHADAAAGLELEITESLIMDDVKRNIASLQAIRALGVTIAIDDFGTGFSSLSYLAKLPVDTLKIDRSFVIEMTSGAQGLSLVSTIINLAHAMKLKVVAEGVETEEQSRLLRLLRCDEMQGFLLSKPVPADIFEMKFLAPAPATAAA